MFVLRNCNSEIHTIFLTNVCTQINKKKTMFNNETMNHSFCFFVAKKLNSMWGLSLPPPPNFGKVHLFNGKVCSVEALYCHIYFKTYI